VVPTNLYCYLNSLPQNEQHDFIGESMEVDYAGGTPFIACTAGAVFSSKAVKAMVESASKRPSPCLPDNDWENINWAVALGKCMKKLGFKPTDERVGTAHRFNAYGPVKTVQAAQDSWFKDYHTRWYKSAPPAGLECCAADTISFHYVGAIETRSIYNTLNNQDKYRAMDISERRKLWGSTPEPYSALPPPGPSKVWSLLLDKIKVKTVDKQGRCI
jgi:hypothetical protein